MVLTSREWHDRHAQEYDSSYENKKLIEIYDYITWNKTIQPYLPENRSAEVLDAGGGTGKWTIPIVKLGYHVTLSDVSEGMLTVAKKKIVKENLLDQVRIVAADIVDMNVFENETFDFILCEGDPLSYCTNPTKAVNELVRVAKHDAIIVASVDNFYSYIGWIIRHGQFDQATQFLKSQRVQSMGNMEFPVYFFKPRELMQRFEEASCIVETIVGKNIFSWYFGEERLRDVKTFDAALKLEMEYCEDPYLLGLAGHIAIVCRKQEVQKLKPKEDAYGREIWAYYTGDETREIVERDDGYMDATLSPTIYFSMYDDWASYEQTAMKFVRGRVLDIGCGAGRHTLYLQNQGFDVLGIDVSPLAIQICKRRGVKKAQVLSLNEVNFPPNSFDTILMMGNNFGLFGSFNQARILLKNFHRITSSNARIIAATRDPYHTENPDHLAYQELNRQKGRMSGQLQLRIRYKKYVTPWFEYLLVSKDELKAILEGTGWMVRTFLDSGNSGYIVIIEKS